MTSAFFWQSFVFGGFFYSLFWKYLLFTNYAKSFPENEWPLRKCNKNITFLSVDKGTEKIFSVSA